MIHEAVSEMERQVEARQAREAAEPVRHRRIISAFDRALSVLEELHETGAVIAASGLRRLRPALLGTIPCPPPAPVLAAGDSVELHSALLDWQEELARAWLGRRAHPESWAGLSARRRSR